MSELLGIARFRFLEGKRDEYLRLSEQAMEIVRTKDSGTLAYDLYLNADQSECMVIERYRDSEAALEHAANLGDMFLRCFTNGALVWLLVQSGRSVLSATSIGAGAVFAIELLQTWLPGQTAEITDPLLAVCAGGLIAVFERDTGNV